MNLAFFAEQGDHAAMKAILDKEDTTDKKNKLLTPIFRELKGQIRHMTYSDEYKLLKECKDEIGKQIDCGGDR